MKNVKFFGGYYARYSAGYNVQHKKVILDVPTADSSLLEHKAICLSALKLEAAGTSET